jgi:F-type H+-transporting ATPase subunit c
MNAQLKLKVGMNGTNLRKKYLTVKSKGTNMKSIIIAGCALVLLSGCASTNKDQLYYDAAKSISKDNTMTMDLISMLQEAAANATEVAKASNLNGSFTLGVAGAGAGIGIGLTGFAAAQAVGRNPGAFGNILVIAIIGMALAEAIAIYAFILALQGR